MGEFRIFWPGLATRGRDTNWCWGARPTALPTHTTRRGVGGVSVRPQRDAKEIDTNEDETRALSDVDASGC
jgi:hypothetical protein